MSSHQLPAFTFTYWNPFDEKRNDFVDSFASYTKDVELANYTSRIVGGFIAKQTEEQLEAIQQLTNEVSNLESTLDWGFSKVNQRLTLIHTEQFNTNLLLKDIKGLLKLPDSEKQRITHIERGMKFFNQALKNEEIISDAVEEFECAINLMKQDWLSSYQLGLCHTYYPSILDFGKAEMYFLKAAKYSAVDSIEGDDFKKVFYESLAISSTKENFLLDFAAECYLNVALIRYICSDFVGAVEFATKATQISETNPKAFFLLAKYNSRIEANQLAIENLKIADNLDNDFYKIFSLDIDILSNDLFEAYYRPLLVKKEKTKKEHATQIAKVAICKIIEEEVPNKSWNYFRWGVGKYNKYCNPEEALKVVYDRIFSVFFQDAKKFEQVMTIAVEKVIEALSKQDLLLKFVDELEVEAEKYFIKNFDANHIVNKELNGRVFGSNSDVQLPPLSLKEAIDKAKWWHVDAIKGAYEKYMLEINFSAIYIYELNKSGFFDSLGLIGNNSVEQMACKVRIEDFVNGQAPRDISYLIDEYLDEMNKPWWKKFF